MDVSKAAWGFAERSVSPASDLIAATHAGGLTAGAFAGKKMLGFVHGFPRTNLAEPCQYSHLLAVLPEAQGRGLSVKLKLFQRDWCLARGIRLVTWTYDPFLLKNATLNLVRLGATVRPVPPEPLRAHRRDLRRPPVGPLRGRLAARRRRAPSARRRGRSGRSPDVAGAPVARSPRALPDAPRVLLPFPAGAPRIYRTDHDGTLRARRRFAALVAAALCARATRSRTSSSAADGSPAYVLDRRIGADPEFTGSDPEGGDPMKKNLFRVLAPAAFLLFSGAALALDDFQVTGNVTEKTADSITVMKGKERFQIADRQGHEGHRRRQGRRQGHDQVQDARLVDRGEGRQGSEARQDDDEEGA